LTFAQFVPLTPLPGTIDFEKWEEGLLKKDIKVEGYPSTSIGSSRQSIGLKFIFLIPP